MSMTRVPAGLASGEASLPGSQTAASPHGLTRSFLCTHGGESALCPFLFLRGQSSQLRSPLL